MIVRNAEFEDMKQLGHIITDVRPSLTKLEVKDKNIVRQLKGIRQKGVFTLFEDKKRIAEEKGELLFTDYGLSGIAVMQLSAFLFLGQRSFLFHLIPPSVQLRRSAASDRAFMYLCICTHAFVLTR